MTLPPMPPWQPWTGGHCPLDPGTRYDAQHRDGTITMRRRAYARDRWDHLGTPCDIVAYRVTECAAAIRRAIVRAAADLGEGA